MKLTSLESTEWALPSSTVTAMSTMGKPNTPPLAMVSSTPFSTAGMYWRGTEPPKTSIPNWKPPPRAARSRISASNAASTTGKYSGLQPAIAALTAAR